MKYDLSLLKLFFATILIASMQSCLNSRSSSNIVSIDTPTVNKSIDINSEINSCIEPVEKNVYKTSVDSDSGNRFVKVPPAPWELVDTIPSQVEGSVFNLSSSSIRKVNDKQEIWISSNVFGVPDKLNNKFVIYNENTKSWSETLSTVGDDIFAGIVFITNNNLVWAVNGWYGSPNDNELRPFLSKYNETLMKFEFVTKTQEIPFNNNKVILDNNGVFWVFVNDDAIYSYNIFTEEIKQYAGLKNIFVDEVKLAPDDSIYFVNLQTLQNGVSTKEIFRFIPSINSVEKVSIYEIEKNQNRLFSNILIDKNGSLWLGDLGWIEPDGASYALLRSNIFLTDIIWTGASSRWANPEILLESSDGRYWFRSENGMAWFSPEKGEWCWFTTYQSNIVEDSDRNLWMIADNKLYKLPLGEQ
ncbi:MAG: hypothetical protein KF758_18810 [Anaerolineales bacterium]|nr:hypothetical protein [Anaerolineales bacterium]